MQVKNNVIDYIIEGLCLILMVGAALCLAIGWNSIPQKIPTHYNLSGEIDRYGSKWEILILLGVLLLLYLLITVIGRFPQLWNVGVRVNPENQERVYRTVKYLLNTMKLIMVAMFSFMILFSAFSRPFPAGTVVLELLLVFGNMIFWLIRLWKVR